MRQSKYLLKPFISFLALASLVPRFFQSTYPATRSCHCRNRSKKLLQFNIQMQEEENHVLLAVAHRAHLDSRRAACGTRTSGPAGYKRGSNFSIR
jgi:hypothetical protein